MLQKNRPEIHPADEFTDQDDTIDLDQLFAIAKRRYKLVIACALVGVLFGVGYLITAIPLYTANVRMLIDNPDGGRAQDLTGIGDISLDISAVDGQVELLRSESIAEKVHDRLNLSDNTMFMSSEGGLISTAKSWISGLVRGVIAQATSLVGESLNLDAIESDGTLLLTEAALKKSVVSKLRDNLAVTRVNRTLVLGISFTSPSPTLAANIANGYADAYIDDQLESKYIATARASDWLFNRTEELRDQSNLAEQAVEAFRRDNDLIATSGTLISEQQLSGLNGQLILARAEVSKSEARYTRLKAIIDNGETEAVVSETVGQSITSGLRSRFLEASKKYAEISNLLGVAHAQAVKLRNEMFQLQRLMFEELKRTTEVARSDVAVARERVSSLELDLEELVGVTNETNQTLIQLRELERNSQSVRTLYTTFLQRYQESLQAQSFSISDARIITKASTPEAPSSPRRSRTLILSMLLGGMLGAGLAALFEFRDRVFRTGEQVRSELGLEFIGMLPIVKHKQVSAKKRKNQSLPPVVEPTLENEGSSELNVPTDKPAAPLISHDNILTYVIDHPLSGFAETLRTAKVAADLTLANKPCKIIGLVSIHPNEGKSTVSKNTASLIANQGARVLLIDGDIRNPGLTRACAEDAEAGLVEIITKGMSPENVIRVEETSGLHFIPTVVRLTVSHTSDLLASPAMRALLEDVASQYDYIIIDLPPMGPVVDVRAMLPLLDSILFVVEWGKTNRKIVRDVLMDDPRLHDKALGVILNKVDKDKLKMYEGYHSKSYYYNQYNKYYTS